MKAKDRDALLDRLQLAMERGIGIYVLPLGEQYSITVTLEDKNSVRRLAHNSRLLVALDIALENALENAK